MQLNDRLGNLLSLLPRVSLIKEFADSPIHELSRCELYSDSNIKIFVKRDDKLGYLYGNKIRYLEYILGSYYHGDYDCIIHGGTDTSNYMLQLAKVCAAHDIPLHLNIIRNNKSDTLNLRLIDFFDAKVYISGDTQAYNGNKNSKDLIFDKLRIAGFKPLLIEYPFGNNVAYLGYASCYLEMLNQLGVRKLGELYSDIFICSRWHSYVGLEVFSRLNQDPVRIHCIQPSYWKGSGLDQQWPSISDFIEEKIHEFFELLGSDYIHRDTLIYEDFVGEKYGTADEELMQLISLVCRYEDFMIDPIYTGKAFQGMINLISRGSVEGPVLFMHTGGETNLLSQLYSRANYNV